VGKALFHFGYLLLAVPISYLVTSFYFEAAPSVETAMRGGAYLLCYLPYFVWFFFRLRNPKLAVRIILGGYALRFFFLAFAGLYFLTQWPEQLRSALLIYLICVGFFIFFEISALITLQFGPGKKMKYK